MFQVNLVSGLRTCYLDCELELFKLKASSDILCKSYQKDNF